jgi:transcriptional regulator with XRE-family HTH domain
MTKVANKLNMFATLNRYFVNDHPNTLSRKLRGDRSMTIDELNAIAKALRIGVDEFIDFEDDVASSP